MPGESLNFPIFAPDHASKNIREVGDAAATTAAKLDIAAASSKLWADTTIKQGKAADTATAAVKAHTKADQLWADTINVLTGKQTQFTKLQTDSNRVLDDTTKKATAAAGGISALAGTGGPGGGGGMAALIGAGVALAPVIVTVGTGLAGFGAAAVAVAQPILKAAQATGGLAANMSKLNPEQQKVAQGLLGLGQQFHVFEKALQPTVLGVFNQGIILAGHLLHDVQPVAKATGVALGGMLGQIDAAFQSRTWQDFFGFMARTAGPDVTLLTKTFVNLTMALPPLLKLLQPTATDILAISAGLTKLVQAGATAGTGLDKTAQHENFLAKTTDMLRTVLFAPGVGLYHALKLLGIIGSGPAAKGLTDTGDAAAVAGPKFFGLNAAVAKLNTSITVLVGNLLTLQGSNVSWQQSVQAATAQLRSNTAGLEGNSKNALANRAAVISATNAAITFAGQQLTLGKNIGGASRTVADQIRWLQSLHDKSQFVRAEIEALRDEEQLLQAQRINQTIHVQGLGQWSVSQSLAPGAGHRRAAGGRVPGYGGGDRWPALLEGGEAIVPKHLTAAVAPFLRAHGVPGFAGGGLVPSYAGSAAMGPWVGGNDKATIQLIDEAIVRATVAGMRAASAIGGVAGPGGGAPAANAALARRMYASQLTPASWAAWNYVAMRESGWNQFALNPSSGAYGIAQALPASKYPFAGQAGGGSNPMAQISWMWNYMASRYGGPLGAEAHEMAFNWYDRGGYLPQGLSLALNTTGTPERVGGGNSYTINVHVPVSANKADIGRQVVETIREFEKRSGNGWRS